MEQTTPETVTIGKQIWMIRNLNVTTFRNGDPIFQAKNDIEWLEASKAKKPACCFQDFHPANEARYGRLYNWYAVGDPRGISPEGWHVPNDREWLELIDFCGEQLAGRKLKSTQGWMHLWGRFYLPASIWFLVGLNGRQVRCTVNPCTF